MVINRNFKSFFIALVLLAACGRLAAEPVSRQQAQQKVQEFLRLKGMDIGAKGLRHAPVRGEQAALPYYVFNVESDGGFVIAAGDDRVPAVLGYSLTGHFDSDEIPENMRSWLAECASQIATLNDAPTPMETESAARPAINSLVSSDWGQRSPFNLLCPKDGDDYCVTGCVATAMAQIMNYHQWPLQVSQGIPAYTSETRHYNIPALGDASFDWPHIKDSYASVYSDEEATAVATLMRYCGQAARMDYSPQGSGANILPAPWTRYFDYSQSVRLAPRQLYSVAEWDALIYHELSEGRPVLYGGASEYGGHAFVCDGYDGDGLFHINWGWNGYCDGYFVLSILNPYQQGTEADLTADAFAYQQRAVIGIRPNDHEVTATVLLARELTADQTAYQRVSTQEDFPPLRLSSKLYNFHRDFTGYFGYAIYGDGGLVAQSMSGKAGTLPFNYVMGHDADVVVDASIPNGVYTIFPVYAESARPDDIMRGEGDQLRITIVGNKLTVGDDVTVDDVVTVKSMEIEGQKIVSRPLMVQMEVTNNGLNENNEFVVSLGDVTTHVSASIPSGQTATVRFPITPDKAGDHVLVVRYHDEVIWSMVVSVEELASYQLGGTIEIVNKLDGQHTDCVEGTTIEGIIEVSNKGQTTYDDDIVIRYHCGQDLKSLVVPARIGVGQTVRLPFTIADLQRSANYGVAAYYRSQGGYADGENDLVLIGNTMVQTYVREFNLQCTVTVDNVVNESGSYTYFNGDELHVTFDVENLADYDYVGNLDLRLHDYADNMNQNDVRPIEIPAHGRIQFESTFGQIKNDVYYWLSVTYASMGYGKDLYSHFFKSVEGGIAVDRNISGDVTITNAMNNDSPFHLEGTAFEGYVTLTNNWNSPYEGNIKLALYNTRTGPKLIIPVEIQPGETKDIPFKFENLDEEAYYSLKVYYYDEQGEEMSISNRTEEAVILTTVYYYDLDYSFSLKNFVQTSVASGKTEGWIDGSAIEGTLHITNNSERRYACDDQITLRDKDGNYNRTKLRVELDGGQSKDVDFKIEADPDKFPYEVWAEIKLIGNHSNYARTQISGRFVVTGFGGGVGPDVIAFADPAVKAICVGHWDTDGDGELSYDEAAAVTDLGDAFSTNSTIVSFDELQYFTGLTAIGRMAFERSTKLASVVLPATITSIGEAAFDACYGLTAIDIPEGVTTIERQAFSRCTGLTSLTLPQSLQSIGRAAFDDCISLTTVTIPARVTSIGESAFSRCSSLREVHTEIVSPFDIADNTFTSATYQSATLYVPDGTRTEYKRAGGWRNFANIMDPEYEDPVLVLTNLSVRSDFLVGSWADVTFSVRNDGGVYSGELSIWCGLKDAMYGDGTDYDVHIGKGEEITLTYRTQLDKPGLWEFKVYMQADDRKKLLGQKTVTAGNESALALIVTMNNGQKDVYLLNEQPVAYFTSDGLLMRSSAVSASYLRSEIREFTFEDVIPDRLISPDSDDKFMFWQKPNGDVSLGGLRHGESVRVVGINGVLLYSAKSGDAQELTIPLSEFPQGVYVISINNKRSIKIQKR